MIFVEFFYRENRTEVLLLVTIRRLFLEQGKQLTVGHSVRHEIGGVEQFQELESIFHAQFLVDMGTVGFDGPQSHVFILRDRLQGISLYQVLQYLFFLAGDPFLSEKCTSSDRFFSDEYQPRRRSIGIPYQRKPRLK